MHYAIEANNINKFYGSKQALKDFSLSVGSGEIFSLLGPNGAGKTTFVKAILNLVRVSSGSMKINDIPATSEKSRQGVAFLPERFNFFPYYTIEDTVRFYGKMQGLKGNELKEQVESAMSAAHIIDSRREKISNMSKGMLQRTGIASTLVGNNHLFILDEPFSGLDPIGIKDLKHIIGKLKKEGKTIFINSHILSEMEQICDGIAILNKGCLLASGNMQEVIGSSSLEDYFYEQVQE